MTVSPVALRLYLLCISIQLALDSYPQYKLPGKFVPSGYLVMAKASGDINQDGLSDMVLVLRNKFEKFNGDTTRPLLILFGDGRGKYRFFARNDSVVLCFSCGGVHYSKHIRRLILTGDRGWSWHIDDPQKRSRVIYRSENVSTIFEKYSNNTDMPVR